MLQLDLSFAWSPPGNRAVSVGADLFEVLESIRRSGSIAATAEELDCSYRHLWGRLRDWEQALGRPVVLRAKGRGVSLTEFAGKLLDAQSRALARMAPNLDNIAAELEAELNRAAASIALLRLQASHDLALARLREQGAERLGIQLGLKFVGSSASLEALARGECDLAGFHVPEDAGRGSLVHIGYRRWLKPRRQRLIGVATRQQGLLVARGNPLRLSGIADLAARDARFVNRARGTGTRLLFDQLLARERIVPGRIRGYRVEESTHLAVAAAVACGSADAGLGIRAAAVEMGLDFVFLARERYFLLCPLEMIEARPVRDLCQYLAGENFAALLAGLPGYAPWQSGQVLPLEQGLPW
ncbi:MAG: helix-turn-helix transcriptional regulator [Rhodocyclaceae bacterium]|nr:helix-turn-helix transcriptional regulator [Rhodocyclaceae bacterium]